MNNDVDIAQFDQHRAGCEQLLKTYVAQFRNRLQQHTFEEVIIDLALYFNKELMETQPSIVGDLLSTAIGKIALQDDTRGTP